MNKKRIGYLVLLACLIGGLCLACYFRRPAVFLRCYYRIELGMTADGIQSLFRRRFDLTCNYRNCTIAYLSRRFLADQDPTEWSVKKPIESINQIPYFYGNAQFLFSKQGKLVAYTCIDEEAHIHTTIGHIKGSQLSKLNEDQWTKITGGP